LVRTGGPGRTSEEEEEVYQWDINPTAPITSTEAAMLALSMR